MATNNANDRLLKFLQAPPAVQAEIDRILNGESRPEPVPRPSRGPLLMGMKAAAEFLGVSRPTLWRMIHAGRLTKIEILPGSHRVRRTDLEAIVEGKRHISPNPEN